ncbi:MAG TPA: heparan-alpha-glucosaminide N-acetyltransferase domain-containing protein [Candidatus Dormibacteraeota bacterium]|nr:heparan-alpha-glucosaminide N-acetyltransferase domain-containing protein [Candidatus Dormibacteraeota bacterium]
MPGNKTKRIAYIDWLRGFACLAMFQTHCYDSWLSGGARAGKFYKWSQLGGTLPAPLFLFLAGVSFALVTDKLRQKGVSANEIAHTTIQRGGEIFLLAFLFRFQEFLLGQPKAPWTDLLRVDVLNVIGISLIMMGIACRIAAMAANPGKAADPLELRKATTVTAIACAAAIAVVTPPLWTTWRPHWLAWWLESYINGVHTFGMPQHWLFPIFPWSAFAFAGLAVGSLLLSDWARRNEVAGLALAGAGGIALIALGLWLDARPVQIYRVYDFWHTSPNFFLIRTGIVLVTVFASYAWCRWGAGTWGFSPMIEMGKASLLVYWVHIEFVYGGLSILPKRNVGIATATLGLIAIFAAMTLLASARNRYPGRKAEIMAFFRRAVRA